MAHPRDALDYVAADALRAQAIAASTAARAALRAAVEQRLSVEDVLLAANDVVTAELQLALIGRAVIEQAKGIIMGERRCSPDEAFAILADLSSRSERKVHDVAHALTESAARRSDPAAAAGDPHR